MWKDLLLMKFENGFRILNNTDPDDKFFVIDDVPKLNFYQIWQLLAYISTNRPTGVLISDRGSLVLVYC